MSSELPERLPAILNEIGENLASTESGMAGSANRLRQLLDTIEEERANVQRDLEQLQLERLVKDPDSHTETDAELRLRQIESEAMDAYARVAGVYRQVTDFGHLLAASQQQFVEGEGLPGVDEAQRLAVQQAMIRAQEDERRRLSREIHDGPAQVLANAIIGLEFIERALRQSEQTENSPAIDEIERIKSALREGLSEIRRFIFDLRPTMLAQRGLVGTIEHYLHAYRSLLPPDIELNIPPDPPELSQEQELTAFRVIQESLQNVHRHARATKSWVSIEVHDNATMIRIRDNGCGFDPESVTTHAGGGSGIIGMRERAEVIGARLWLSSKPGEGSEVCLELPKTSKVARDPLGGAAQRRGTN